MQPKVHNVGQGWYSQQPRPLSRIVGGPVFLTDLTQLVVFRLDEERYALALAVSLPFLRGGVFRLQQIQPVSLARLERKLGLMSAAQLTALRQTIVRLGSVQK